LLLQAAIQKAAEDARMLALELERQEALKIAQEELSATKIQSVARSRSAKIAVDNKKAEVEAAKAEVIVFSY
jgi:hypothetical protein